jgi:hypothetical protein
MKQPPSLLGNFLWMAFGFFMTLFCLGPILILGGIIVLASSASRDAKIKTASMFVGVVLGYALFVYMDAQGMIGWR